MKKLLLILFVLFLSCSKDSTSSSGLFRDNLDKTYFILPTDDPNNPEFFIEFGKNFLLKIYDYDGTCQVWTKEGTYTYESEEVDGSKLVVKNEILLEEETTYQIRITSEHSGYEEGRIDDGTTITVIAGDWTETSEFEFSYGEIDDAGNVLGMLWFSSFVDSQLGKESSPSGNLRQILTLPSVVQSRCFDNINDQTFYN